MNKIVDLHCHTTCSDGSDSPRELVRKAKALGLAAVATTDHDTFDAHSEAIAAGAEFGIEVVPGVELSSVHMGKHIHLLAYYCDTKNKALSDLMERAVNERVTRNRAMVQRLHDAGYPVDWETVSARYPGQVMIGRPHVAQLLMDRGVIKSVREGVENLMGKGGPFYVERYHVPLTDYVRAVREAGGVPVIAHLFQYRFPEDQLRQMIRDAVDAGLMGLEAMYSTYTPEQQDLAFDLTREFHLIPTGGSDYHGTSKPHIALGAGTGTLAVPYELLQGLKETAQRL